MASPIADPLFLAFRQVLAGVRSRFLQEARTAANLCIAGCTRAVIEERSVR